MATSTELLRAAEHMREQAVTTSDRVLSRAFAESAEMLEAEAERLQCPTGAEIVIQIDGVMVVQPRPKRSWPEGWPPFAVLRRAFHAMGVSHKPSTASVERHARGPSEADFARRKAAKNRRHAWARAVKIEMLETITISEPSSP